MSETEPALGGEGGDVLANEVRGEDELRLGRKTYVLRPSYEAIKAAEKKTGLALLEMVAAGHSGRISAEQLGVIAGELIRAGATDDMTRRLDPDRIGELIYEQGIPAVTSRLTLLLVSAASGGRTALGERKPVAETLAS